MPGFVALTLAANSAQVVLLPMLAGGLWWITASDRLIGREIEPLVGERRDGAALRAGDVLRDSGHQRSGAELNHRASFSDSVCVPPSPSVTFVASGSHTRSCSGSSSWPLSTYSSATTR